MSNQINLVDVEFSAIKESLKEFLKKQDTFKDYNFEGSGMNVLLDVLAYNSQNNAYLANMLANEAELDTAVLRSNVVSRAKLLGYTPKSISAASAIIRVRIEDDTKTQDSLFMPRGTKFTVRSDGQQFLFLTLTHHDIPKVSNGVYEGDVTIHEGLLKAYSYDVTSHERRYILPTNNIDTSTLRVAVYETAASSDYEEYKPQSSILKIDDQTPAYWLSETDGGKFEIRFGDGNFGKQPPLNGLVYVEYLVTSGAQANNLSRYSLLGQFEGYENADITIHTVRESSGGSERETTESIRLNAPRFFQSQNRAVTVEDFRSVAQDIYPNAKSIAVWSGGDVNPPKFGQVLIAIIPHDNLPLTSSNKRALEARIKERTVAGITPKIIDPNFIQMNLSVKISAKQPLRNVRESITQWFNTELGNFDADFYYARLLSHLTGLSRHVVSANASYTLSITKSFKANETLTYQFDNPIISVETSSVTIHGESQKKPLEAKYNLLVDHRGQVHGRIDFDKGIVTLDTKGLKDAGSIEIFVTPKEDDVVAAYGSAIVLNQNRLRVEERLA